MSARLAKQAGGALAWKAIQLAGIKGIFVVRLLILARLLSPEDFGLLAIATVTIGVLMSITDFGMMPALVQRTDPAEQDYHAAWVVGVMRALAVTGVVVLTAPVVAGLFGEPQAAAIIQMLALRPLLQASASIKVADLTRNLSFRSLAFTSLPEALVNTLVSIALARALGVWALVVGTLAGSAAYVAMSYLLAPYRPRLALDMVAARPLIRYGRWIFVTSLVAMAGSSVLQAVISRRLGAAELGLYFLAAKLAFLPYEVASEVVGAVTFPLYARLRADVLRTALAFRAIVRGMAALLIPVHTLIIALAPSLVRNVLGPRWAGAEPVIQVLALAGMVGLLTDASVPLFKGLGQPQKIAALETIQSLLLVVLGWSLAGRYGLIGAALSWLPAVAVSQVTSTIFVRQVLPQPFTGLGKSVLAIIVASGAGTAVALSVDRLLPGLGGLVTIAFLSVAAMGLLLWALDRSLGLGILADLSRAFPHVAAFLRLAPADS